MIGPLMVRASLRAGGALVFLAAGNTATFHVLMVLAVLSLIGPLEMEFSKAAWAWISAPSLTPVCRECNGAGALDSGEQDDNCCPVCMGVGRSFA